jgi:hypothetical protein
MTIYLVATYSTIGEKKLTINAIGKKAFDITPVPISSLGNRLKRWRDGQIEP